MDDITYNSYWEEVASISKEVIDAVNNRETEFPYDYLWETIDGHQWIIYNAFHDDVLKFTSNADAYLDSLDNESLGKIVAEQGMDHARMVQAFQAFHDDVSEKFWDDKKEFLAELGEQLEMLEEEKAEIEKDDDLSDELDALAERIEIVEETMEALR